MYFSNRCQDVDPQQIRMEENQSKDRQPMFLPRSFPNDRVRSAYLLNRLYQLMSRFGISRKSPLALQQLLQSIFLSNAEHATSTLYLEAQIFPWIFPFQENGAIVGALPHSLYINPLSKKKHRGVATLLDHMRVRIMDGSLLTAVEPDYICWAFDIIMNYMANYNTIPLAIKKGPEFMTRKGGFDGIDVGPRETSMMFDSIESRGPVNELAALVRTLGKWDYFVTITCNDQRTPGMAFHNHPQNFRLCTIV